MWSIPLIPTGANLADAAAGKYDANYLAMAQQLVANAGGQSQIYVRLGWEFNGAGWNSSSAVGQPENYAAAFRDFVTIARSVSDKFVFEWTPNAGPTDMNPETAYPGDKYVDVIGTDFYYNTQWDSKDAKTAFNYFVSEPYGLQWQQDFAAAHGKPTAIGEWGLNSDNPEYVKLVADWAKSHNMLYQNYWDSNAAFQGQLSSGQFPTAAAAYQALFGSQADGHTNSFGSSTADILHGGAAGSTTPVLLFGGDGNDTYYVDSAKDRVFEAAGATAGIDTVNASISYTLTANVENLNLTGTACINATGNDMANVIKGNGGANVIDGGAGADIMTGGNGNDTYYVDNAGDVVIEAAGATAGIDTVNASISYALTANVENLNLIGAADINATGNALANIINGNSGANVIDGGAGADSLRGGDGNDTYYVDNAGDQVVEYYNGGKGGVDTVYASVSYTLPVNVENLHLTGTADINATGNGINNLIYGNDGNNIIDGGGPGGGDQLYGGGGNDTLIGANGMDILDGGTGADIMRGGDNNDTYYVDNAGDQVMEAAGATAGVDTVNASISYALTANVENLNLAGTSNLNGTGNDLANTITGNSGANVIDGGGGADIMRGGDGNDTYYVDNAGDQVVEYYNAGAGGNDTVYASISYTLPVNVENLNLTGTANINATGNNIDNIIHGNAGNNRIDGGTGTDMLFGGDGADVFAVGLMSGRKTIGDFGAGDTIDISAYLAAHLTPKISVSGGNTILTFDSTNSITLLGVTQDHLHATANGYSYG